MGGIIRQVDLSEVGPTPKGQKYIGFEWSLGDDSVYFTVCWRGKALNCHVGVKERRSKLQLRRAITEFTQEMRQIYQPECILALTDNNHKSLKNTLKKVGFESMGVFKNKNHELDCMRLL